MVRNYLIRCIDFFYRPFSGILPLRTFRYGVTGGSNALLNLILFYLSYHDVFRKHAFSVAGITVTPYISAYLLALSVTFPAGFLLNRYIVFEQQEGKGSKQLFLYAVLTLTTIFLHYILLHLLVGYWHLWATASQAFIIVLMAVFSYYFQTYVTFRTNSDTRSRQGLDKVGDAS